MIHATLRTQRNVNLQPKAREAEDAWLTKTYPLKRQISDSQLQSIASQCLATDEVSKRTGGLWKCTDRIPNKFGYVYRFKLKDKYDNVTLQEGKELRLEAAMKKLERIYPATERLGSELDNFDPKIKNELHEVLKQLGYKKQIKNDGVYLHLPDKDVLLAQWEELRMKRPELSPLDILSVEGIASDLDFVEAFFSHDVLLSSDKQFVHDHFAHMIPTISLKIASGTEGNPPYQKERKRLVKWVNGAYRCIMVSKKEMEKQHVNHVNIGLPKESFDSQLEKMQAALGALIDYMSSINSYAQTARIRQGSVDQQLHMIWDEPHWKKYWHRRYPTENIDGPALAAFWWKIKKIEIQTDNFEQIAHRLYQRFQAKMNKKISRSINVMPSTLSGP